MTETITGRQAILRIGGLLSPNFSLNDKDLDGCYQKVYNALVEAIRGQESNRGVILFGRVGCGKTLCMRIMHQLFRDSRRKFLFKRAVDIRDMLEEMSIGQIKEQVGYGLKADLYIDDIGVLDADIKKYGNTISLIGEIILDRYELYKNEGFLTHFSTNIIPQSTDPNSPSLEKYFGDRVFDRIQEMTKVVFFKNKSLRK